MRKHFRVQSVLLSANQAALTLSPVEWTLPDPAAGMDDEGFPKSWIDAEPEDEGAEPFEPGGSKTELRFAASDFAFDPEAAFMPDQFVSITIEPTTHTWQP